MRRITILLLICFLLVPSALAQGNIFAFYEYDIKDGKMNAFVAGYARDLEWHKSQNDDWSWVGWFVLNGNRRGRFIDATPNHKWEDFDKWKINRAENLRLNKIHWIPYIENYSGSFRKVLSEYSKYDDGWITKRFLQVYYIEIKPGKEEAFRTFLGNYKPIINSVFGDESDESFVWVKTISGGGANEYLLFVGLDKIEKLELAEKLFDFTKSQDEIANMYSEAVDANRSELWGYNAKLTLLAE